MLSQKAKDLLFNARMEVVDLCDKRMHMSRSLTEDELHSFMIKYRDLQNYIEALEERIMMYEDNFERNVR